MFLTSLFCVSLLKVQEGSFSAAEVLARALKTDLPTIREITPIKMIGKMIEWFFFSTLKVYLVGTVISY